MKLTKIVIASTLSAFAFISTAAMAETFNFGEGQSSMSGTGGASHHTPPPKHKKPKKTQRAADKGAYSHP
jgi:Spy/CpxP family protein refolding chaperone